MSEPHIETGREGLLIPDQILKDPCLTWGEKFLVAVIEQFDTDDTRRCDATNDQISDVLKMGTEQVHMLIYRAIRKGILIRTNYSRNVRYRSLHWRDSKKHTG